MKRYEIVIRIVVFAAIIVVVLLQSRTLMTLKRRFNELTQENADLKKKNDEMALELEVQKRLVSGLEGNAVPDKDILNAVRAENKTLRKKNEKLAEKLAEKEAEVASLKKDPETGEEPGEETASTGEDERAERAAGMKEYLEKMLESPEMRDMLWQSQRASLDMIMGDLFSSLDLTDEEMGRFKDLLADKQLLALEMGLALGKTDAESEERAKAQEEMKERMEKHEEDIQLLLGDARYEQYKDYSDSLADRMVVSQYKKRLADSGVASLDDRQEEELLQAIAEEKKDFTFSTEFADQNNFDFSRFTEENQKTFFKEREQLAERVLERSKDILTQQQWEQYKASIESQLKLERMQMEMAVSLFSGGSNVKAKTSEVTDEEGDTETAPDGETEEGEEENEEDSSEN